MNDRVIEVNGFNLMCRKRGHLHWSPTPQGWVGRRCGLRVGISNGKEAAACRSRLQPIDKAQLIKARRGAALPHTIHPGRSK